MPGNLLIIRENGRNERPYGINLLIDNMKNYHFVCIVILLSCTVHGSYQFQYYPDTKYDSLSSPPDEPRRYDDELPPYLLLRPNYNYEPNAVLDDDDDDDDVDDANANDRATLPDRFERITRFLNDRALKLKAYVDGESMLRIPDDIRPDVSDLNTIVEDFGKLTMHLRPRYAKEDGSSDFEFPDSDANASEDVQEEHEEAPNVDDRLRLDTSRFANILRSNERDVIGAMTESSGRRPNDDDVMEDVEFAYRPGDPRFYQSAAKMGVENSINANYKRPDVEVYDPLKNINVKVRNDEERIKSSESGQQLPTATTMANRRTESSVDIVPVRPPYDDSDTAGVYIIAVVAGISAAATVALIAFGIGWYNLQKHVKNASDVEYPAYGVTGPNKEISPSGDRRLAQSAQMYHYQHQKQQIIAMESRAAANDRHGSMSEADSDEENEEGDYTVYECPGLAPTGEMEVKNPLFQDDPTPAQTPAVKSGDEVQKK